MPPVNQDFSNRTRGCNAAAHALLEAFEEGLNREVQYTDASRDRQFSEILCTRTRERLPVDDWEQFELTLQRHQIIIETARRGDVVAATQRLSSLRTTLERAPLADATRSVLNAFDAPVEAYLQFCSGDCESARALLTRSLALVSSVMRSDGFHELVVLGLQIVHNLIRVRVRQGHIRQAIRTAAEVLVALERRIGPIPELPLNHAFCLEFVPADLIDYHFERVCGEVALIFVESESQRQQISLAFTEHDGETCPRPYVGPCGHAWLRYQQIANTRGSGEAANTIATLLRIGRGSAPTLWYACVLEAARLLRRIDEANEHLVSWMLSAAAAANDAPWAVKEAARRTEVPIAAERRLTTQQSRPQSSPRLPEP